MMNHRNMTKKFPTPRDVRRSAGIYLCLIAAEGALAIAVLSLAATVPLALILDAPIGAAFAVSVGLLGILFPARLYYLRSVRKKEFSNMAYLADEIDQPVEFRCPIVFRQGFKKCLGYLFLTYDDCYLVAKGDRRPMSDVRDSSIEWIRLRKSESYGVKAVGEQKILLMPTADSAYIIDIFPMRRLIYLMDRDSWRVLDVSPSRK